MDHGSLPNLHGDTDSTNAAPGGFELGERDAAGIAPQRFRPRLCHQVMPSRSRPKRKHPAWGGSWPADTLVAGSWGVPSQGQVTTRMSKAGQASIVVAGPMPDGELSCGSPFSCLSAGLLDLTLQDVDEGAVRLYVRADHLPSPCQACSHPSLRLTAPFTSLHCSRRSESRASIYCL